MKANEVNLTKFLAQADTQFLIPVYQRNYDWNIGECKQLFEDILSVGVDEKRLSHFIGSIVYIHDDIYSSAGINELSIIDGQQRLTTITLLYIAIFVYAQQTGNTTLVNKIMETYLINKFADEGAKLKLKPTDNNDKALKFLLRNDPSDSFTEYSRLIENYNFFISSLTTQNFDVIQKGLSKVIFVEISLERTKDDPQKIFESLNSTGLELNQADLIRNYILMGLKHKDQTNIYENYWRHIETHATNKDTNTNRVSEFIRDFLTLEKREIPNKNKVYVEFKNKFAFESIEELEGVLSKVKRYSTYYHRLINPSAEPDVEIRKQLSFINKLEINVSFPFLLEVYSDYASEMIDKKVFIEVLELIQSFTWRRFIVSLPTNALNKIFMRLYEDVDKTKYLYSLQLALLKKKSIQRFPRNQEIVTILKDRDMYGIQSKNRSYFLDRLENLDNREPVYIEGNSDITIEHIFPQNPDPRWKLELNEDEFVLLKEKYLNTIANLTLSGNNGKLSNKYFSDKRDMNIDNKEQGYRYSRLWLNRHLATLSAWNVTELLKRYDLISSRFLNIWKFPDIVIDEAFANEEINVFEAEDPSHKKLDYVIFFDQKFEFNTVSQLYEHVMRVLFDLTPTIFFTQDLEEKIGLTKSPIECVKAISLNETYYIEGNLSSKMKFERIKLILSSMDITDELFIKYAEGA
ncbi:DUF262 domain-containing protein [Mucilaginibacter flavus]|uniref:DUF262 domain-containing protein n=1 Tax=Mucilaginibacter flavus TaxID=931504 RepID=UPI0025B3DE47|nr:DUF262 domain-containing protein [Mucilaginibacter flavus]MDN3581893.1 DUF262 domain-containing protein [Mucilaginibacter flavus]